MFILVVVGFRLSRETMETFCAAEFLSASASSGVAEVTDAGVAIAVALSTGVYWQFIICIININMI